MGQYAPSGARLNGFFHCWQKKKRSWNFLCYDLKKEPYISQILLKLSLSGNRSSCRLIRSVIILVIKQIGPNWNRISPVNFTYYNCYYYYYYYYYCYFINNNDNNNSNYSAYLGKISIKRPKAHKNITTPSGLVQTKPFKEFIYH